MRVPLYANLVKINLTNIANTKSQVALSEQLVEFGSERMPRSLLRGKRANDERYCSLRI
jgi:hypothetical protein